jgi:nucleoside-diphosphate-sugar epimerase
MSSVLVTGAAGFIGRHLVAALRRRGDDVIVVDTECGDVAEASTWRDYPAAEAVVHIAGRSFVPESWEVPGDFVRTNVLGTVAALEYCRRHAARLVFPSSYMYGNAVRQPIAEDAALICQNPYALSKRLAEESCRFFADRCGVPVTVLRPFNIYGPGQAEAFLVPTIIGQVARGQEIRVRDLEPRRDYVYVLDVVEAMVKALTCARPFATFNIGSGTSHSVAELVRTVQDVWGTDLPVRSDGVRRRDEVMDTIADISLARRELGWYPRFTLRQGIEHLRAAS